jgi:hypothetical protein
MKLTFRHSLLLRILHFILRVLAGVLIERQGIQLSAAIKAKCGLG